MAEAGNPPFPPVCSFLFPLENTLVIIFVRFLGSYVLIHLHLADPDFECPLAMMAPEHLHHKVSYSQYLTHKDECEFGEAECFLCDAMVKRKDLFEHCEEIHADVIPLKYHEDDIGAKRFDFSNFNPLDGVWRFFLYMTYKGKGHDFFIWATMKDFVYSLTCFVFTKELENCPLSAKIGASPSSFLLLNSQNHIIFLYIFAR